MFLCHLLETSGLEEREAFVRKQPALHPAAVAFFCVLKLPSLCGLLLKDTVLLYFGRVRKHPVVSHVKCVCSCQLFLF